MIGMNTGQAMVSVGVAMILQDQFTNQANNIGRAYRDMMEEIYQSSKAPRGLTELVWSRGASVAALTTMGGMIDSYQYMAEAENDLFLVQKMTNASLQDREDIMKRIQEVNLKTPLETTDLTSAARFMAMAGNTPKGIMGMMEPVAELASIFGMEAGGKGGVADLFTNISMMFGRNLEDQDEAFNVANELYAVTTRSNTNLSDLAQAITYSGAEMRRAGYGLRETAASIGVMGNLGIQGSAAGTALANMMRYIQLSASGQKKKGDDMLKAVGIDAKSLMDSQGHLIPLLDIYKKMYEVTKDLDTFSKNEFFYNVFGVRGTREIAAMVQMLEDAATSGDIDKYTQLMEAMQEATSSNSVRAVADERAQESKGQLDLLNSQLDILRYNVGKSLKEPFDNVLKLFNGILALVNKFSTTGLGGALIRSVAIGTATQLVLRGFTAIRGVVRMVTAGTQTLASTSSRLASGPTAANSQFVLMEAHLRTLIVLMGQYMAMSNMIPKGGIATPYGNMYAKNGKAMMTGVVDGQKLNRGLNNYLGAAAGASIGAAAGNAAGKTITRGLSSRLTGMLGIFGGPWGIALSIGLPLIIDLLTNNNSEQQKQTDLLEQQLTSSELKDLESDALIKALKAACKEGIIDGVGSAKPVPVEVTVEGGGNYSDISLDDNDYNIF